MNRRNVLISLSALGLAGAARAEAVKPLNLTDAEWQKRLPPAAYAVLRKVNGDEVLRIKVEKQGDLSLLRGFTYTQEAQDF